MHSRTLLSLAAVVLVLSCAGCITQTERPTGADATLSRIVDAIESEQLALREANLANAARIPGTGLDSNETRRMLGETLLEHPWTVSSLVIDKDGIVRTVVPENYRAILGSNWSSTYPVDEVNRLQAPFTSNVLLLGEGFDGVIQSAPVFSDGKYQGYVDITYRPEVLIGRAVKPVIAGSEYDVWVAQADGRVLYDINGEEIGRNLLSDPIYQDPGGKEFFSRVVSESSGAGVYRYWDSDWDRQVTKDAVWATAGIDGAKWRVVLTRTESSRAVSTVAPSTGVGTVSVSDIAALDEFVASAAAYGRGHGREEALSVFNDQKGEFTTANRYVFAYEMNGTVLALPFQPGILGEDRRGVVDANGVAVVDSLILAASFGGGHVYYVYPDPSANYAERLKISSVLPVDDGWFVGSGLYLSHLDDSFSESRRDALVQRVKKARDYAQSAGREQAVAAFNDRSGEWARGGDYIFAYDMNGTTLALPFQPELVGTNRLDYRDKYGVAGIRWEAGVAKQGGGSVYLVYYNPDTGGESLKLCYVAPVDETWFVGSGIYGSEV